MTLRARGEDGLTTIDPNECTGSVIAASVAVRCSPALLAVTYTNSRLSMVPAMSPSHRRASANPISVGARGMLSERSGEGLPGCLQVAVLERCGSDEGAHQYLHARMGRLTWFAQFD